MFLESIEMGIGLEIVRWFQTIRTPLLDIIALMFHYAVSGAFYVVVLGGIYWMYDKKLGARMLFALIIIGLCSLVLKDVFARPRPFQVLDSGIMPLVYDSSYGIPSGHSSFTFVVWGFFAYWMKNRAITIAVIIFTVFMGFSRMYMGVHFPQDVIAGWLLGAVVLGLYIRYVENVISWWHKQSLAFQIALPLMIGAVMMFFFLGSVDGLTTIGLLVGISVAVALETRFIQFQHKDSLAKRAIQFVIGLAIIGGILFVLDNVFDMIAPPTYAYVANPDAVSALQALQVEAEFDDATSICLDANEAGYADEFDRACRLQVTPFLAFLRVLRYGLFGIFAVSLIPLLSIRLNLMEKADSENKTKAV